MKSGDTLAPLTNGWPADTRFHDPVGGPYVASATSIGRCFDTASCKAGYLPGTATLVEFHNALLNHYFITAGASEAAGIDAGHAGPGWSRTGYAYSVFANPSGTPEAVPVCRFYGTPGRGPNSHFFTLDVQACAGVQADPGWTLETSTAFAVTAPTRHISFPAGVATYDCGARQAVYRLYNNRFAANDSNHRYTADTGVYALMQANGWIGEGMRFCAER